MAAIDGLDNVVGNSMMVGVGCLDTGVDWQAITHVW